FDALAPAELDLFSKAMNALYQEDEQLRQAQQQQLQRLRFQARLAERQVTQTDPDNRLVAAELGGRWEAAVREVQQTEARRPLEQQPRLADALSEEDKEAFLRAGKDLPELWRQGRLSPQQQKAFLRCLIDKVVIHRCAPDTLQVRIVWKGGETTTR